MSAEAVAMLLEAAARIWADDHPEEMAELSESYTTSGNRFLWAAERALWPHIPACCDAPKEWSAPDEVKAIALLDGWDCHYCGATLAGSQAGLDLGLLKPTVDHVVPRAAGGGDEIDNKVLACGPCNSKKGAKPYLQFRREMS